MELLANDQSLVSNTIGHAGNPNTGPGVLRAIVPATVLATLYNGT